MVSRHDQHRIGMRLYKFQRDRDTGIEFQKLVENGRWIVGMPGMVDPTTFNLKNKAILLTIKPRKRLAKHIAQTG